MCLRISYRPRDYVLESFVPAFSAYRFGCDGGVAPLMTLAYSEAEASGLFSCLFLSSVSGICLFGD